MTDGYVNARTLTSKQAAAWRAKHGNAPLIVPRAPLFKALEYATKAGITHTEIARRAGLHPNFFWADKQHATIDRRRLDRIYDAVEELVRERRTALTDLQSSVVWAKQKTGKK